MSILPDVVEAKNFTCFAIKNKIKSYVIFLVINNQKTSTNLSPFERISFGGFNKLVFYAKLKKMKNCFSGFFYIDANIEIIF